MLLDDEERLVELFMDNVLWGNIQIKMEAIGDESKIPMEQRMGYQLGAFSRLRRDKIRNEEYTKTVKILHSFFVRHRILGDIVGELRDRDHEEKLKKLEEDNEQLAEIIADQKKQLNQLYLESPDKKNIRGIT